MLCTDASGNRIEKVAYVQVGSGSGSSSSGSSSGDFEFTGSASSVATGGTVTLRWSAPGATSCNASGDWSGSKSSSGATASPVMNQAREYQYWLICNGSNGRKEGVVRVQASGSGGSSGGGSSGSNAPTVNFSASKTKVRDNESVTLNWSATGATSCTASGAWSGGQSTSGSRQVTADLSNRSYSLTCSNSSGSTLSIVSLDVTKVVNLAWTPPTRDEDGSPVSALAGYNVKYGTRSGQYSTTKFVNGRTNTRTSLELSGGTYYFVVTALSEAGLESRNSAEAVANLR